MNSQKPQSLFKYLRFDEKLLELLCCKFVYYADPANFNDPLDCKPVVKSDADISKDELEHLLAEMIERRSRKEFDVAMKKLKLQSENATTRCNALAESEAQKQIRILRCEADNPNVRDKTAHHRDMLTRAIGHEMRKGYSTGVLCLSSKFNSPLMWSHYADQHRGVCIEYDVSIAPLSRLHKVSYGTPRVVSASLLHDLIIKRIEDKYSEIEKACLLTKSREWSYEREWRLLLGSQGTQLIDPIRLKSIIFGMRCTDSLRYSIVRVLEDRYKLEGPGKVKLWQITNPSSKFELKRKPIDFKVIKERMSAADGFENLEEKKAYSLFKPPNLAGY